MSSFPSKGDVSQFPCSNCFSMKLADIRLVPCMPRVSKLSRSSWAMFCCGSLYIFAYPIFWCIPRVGTSQDNDSKRRKSKHPPNKSVILVISRFASCPLVITLSLKTTAYPCCTQSGSTNTVRGHGKQNSYKTQNHREVVLETGIPIDKLVLWPIEL